MFVASCLGVHLLPSRSKKCFHCVNNVITLIVLSLLDMPRDQCTLEGVTSNKQFRNLHKVLVKPQGLN